MKMFKILVIAGALVLFISFGALANQFQYGTYCIGCHAVDEITGEINSLDGLCGDEGDIIESVDEAIICYNQISDHLDPLLEDCDQDCIESTNEYVYDELLADYGESQYGDYCVDCHGYDGMSPYPIDGDPCDISSIEALEACYPTINAHSDDSLDNCGDACVWNTNRYIYEGILNDSEDDNETNADEDNFQWVSCFIETLIK
ncbi:MAG: hypothetical protein GY874_14110 [Desulfobacteraceae bacterium]|nr:hypothetical protein [Desulfobacteraceae bacterium]